MSKEIVRKLRENRHKIIFENSNDTEDLNDVESPSVPMEAEEEVSESKAYDTELGDTMVDGKGLKWRLVAINGEVGAAVRNHKYCMLYNIYDENPEFKPCSLSQAVREIQQGKKDASYTDDQARYFAEGATMKCECGSTNIIEEGEDTLCDDCGRKINVDSQKRESTNLNPDKKSAALRKSLIWWNQGHYQKAVELYRKYGASDAEFARLLISSLRESSEEETSEEFKEDVMILADDIPKKKKDKLSGNIIRALQTPISTASRPNIADAIPEGTEIDDVIEESAREDYFGACNRYRIGNTNNFERDMNFLRSQKIGITVELVYGNKTRVYARKVANNKWKTDDGKFLTDNDVVSVAFDGGDATINYMVKHTNESKRENSKKSLRESDYMKFNIPNTRVMYSYQKYIDGSYGVKGIHPYDDADYHWAISKDGDTWKIYIHSPGKLVKTIRTDGDFHKVARVLDDLDKNIKSRMSHN